MIQAYYHTWTIQVKSGTLWDMASPIGYQTFCPVGAALNVVGERWALLIVRDLFLGPRRYSELLKGLGGIPTDILAAPDSEPDTTIDLTRSGMRSLILGARASEIEQTGDLSIQRNRRRAHALLNTITGPPRLAGLRPQLEAGAADAERGDQRR